MNQNTFIITLQYIGTLGLTFIMSLPWKPHPPMERNMNILNIIQCYISQIMSKSFMMLYNNGILWNYCLRLINNHTTQDLDFQYEVRYAFQPCSLTSKFDLKALLLEKGRNLFSFGRSVSSFGTKRKIFCRPFGLFITCHFPANESWYTHGVRPFLGSYVNAECLLHRAAFFFNLTFSSSLQCFHQF